MLFYMFCHFSLNLMTTKSFSSYSKCLSNHFLLHIYHFDSVFNRDLLSTNAHLIRVNLYNNGKLPFLFLKIIIIRTFIVVLR